MGKISIDLSTIKAAGVYTAEIDNSTRTSITTNSLRMIPGFSNKGPFNRPVYLSSDIERVSIFGEIDAKLEHKGCFFNRMMRTMLADGPIIALNLLKTDDSINGPDQVNFATMSLDAATPNPKAGASKKYGEYDYSGADSINMKLYKNFSTGDMLPFVGNTPFSSLYNRSRFWIPDKDLLTAAAANALNTADMASGSGSYEHTNLLNFANVGTEEFSILVFKPENISGYDITAESWYNGRENIPYGWIRPSDYISDYFLQVICVKGNWTNYPILSSDNVWSSYFEKSGIIKSRINNFLSAEGVQVLGSWIGCIIPDFVNRQGENLSLERKVNARTEVTGLLMSFNEDAAHVLNADYTGADLNENDDFFDNNDAKFIWGIDIDGDNEIDSLNGEGAAPYIVDLVGHGIYAEKEYTSTSDSIVGYKYFGTTEKVGEDEYKTALSNGEETVATAKVSVNGSERKVSIEVLANGEYVIDFTADFEEFATDDDTKSAYVEAFKSVEVELNTEANIVDGSKKVDAENLTVTFKVEGYTPAYYAAFEQVVEYTEAKKPAKKLVTMLPSNFINYAKFTALFKNPSQAVQLTMTNAKSLVANSVARQFVYDVESGEPVAYELKGDNEEVLKNIPVEGLEVRVDNAGVIFFDVDEEGEMITNLNDVMSDTLNKHHTLKLRFAIDGVTYFAYFEYTALRRNRALNVYSLTTGCQHDYIKLENWVNVNEFTEEEAEKYNAVQKTGDNGVEYYYYVTEDTYDGRHYWDEDSNIPDALRHILVPKTLEVDEVEDADHSFGFLSYTFDESSVEGEADPAKLPLLEVESARYFNDPDLYYGRDNTGEVVNKAIPVDESFKNIFIVTDSEQWDYITVGTFVRNITFENNPGEANTYKVIPGITRVIDKRFVPFVQDVDSTYMANYRGKYYRLNPEVFNATTVATMKAKNGAVGFYVYTAIDPVLIEKYYKEDGTTVDHTYITRQLPLSNPVFSKTLRFIPMKGLKITSKHRPGYDVDGNISIEGGISKIYSVLEEPGIQRGLCNPTMVDYRYIVDSMSYGLDTGLGGKVYLSRLAELRGKTLAILNMPSAKQFAVSANPIFCDSYTSGVQTRPSFDTKYIPMGGNLEMGSSKVFSLPDEADGSKYAAAFWPNLTYNENGRTISVPPAADVCNVLASKFTGVNSPYAINANMNGIIRNRYVTGVEFDADTDDRGYLEPMGVNTIIRENGVVMIYGNQTCYQTTKSDLNKLHIRETLNTIEIECTAQLKQFNFLYNTASTRAAIVQTLTPILQVMQVSGAIDTFVITCDESNNTPEIIEGDYGIVDIGVWFNHGMEKILTRITINRYGTQNGGSEGGSDSGLSE